MPHNRFSHIDTWIFDLDNTLYPDSGMEDIIRGTFYEYVKNELGIERHEAEVMTQTYQEKYGHGVQGWWEEHGLKRAGWDEFFHNRVDYSFLPQCVITQEKLSLLPGRKVIFTNAPKSHADKVMDHLKITHHFDHLSYACERGERFKPDQDIYEELVDTLGADPEKCAMFEDQPLNLLPAHNLGMTTVLVEHDPVEEEYVHHYFKSLKDWLEEIPDINSKAG